MGAGRANRSGVFSHWLVKWARRLVVPLVSAGVTCSLAVMLSLGVAGAQEPVPDPFDFDPLLLSHEELPVDFIQPVSANTDESGGEVVEPDCGQVGPAATFVASTEVTTITTDTSDAVALYTSTTPGGSYDSLTLVDCPAPVKMVGQLRTHSFDTVVGQRYWMSHAGGDSDISTARNADVDDPDLAMRFALVSGLTWRQHGGLFHEIPGRDLPPGADDTCLQNPVWFSAQPAADSVTVWFDAAVDSVALYQAPDDDDPKAPSFGGPDVLMSCEAGTFEQSPTGSAELKVMTEPGRRYVLGWSSSTDAVVAVDPPADVDERFAAPVRFDDVAPEAWVPGIDCGDNDGLLRIGARNEGPLASDVVATLRQTGGADLIDDGVVATYSLNYVGRSSWTTGATLPDGDYEVEIRVDGTVVASPSFVVDCDVGEILPVPDSPRVHIVTSCVGQRVRIDVVIENHSDTAAVYIAEFRHASFSGETPDFEKRKSAAVAANGQGRITITGREPYLNIEINVFRNGILVDATDEYRECDENYAIGLPGTPVVTTSCLAGNGLIRYVIPNQTGSSKSWIINFEGLSNRSTSAGPLAVGLGGISGRADGVYAMQITSGGVVVWAAQVTIDCD